MVPQFSVYNLCPAFNMIFFVHEAYFKSPEPSRKPILKHSLPSFWKRKLVISLLEMSLAECPSFKNIGISDWKKMKMAILDLSRGSHLKKLEPFHVLNHQFLEHLSSSNYFPASEYLSSFLSQDEELRALSLKNVI